MVYNTQNCWVLGLCPSSSILETRKHKVLEIAVMTLTGVVQWLRLALSKGPNWAGIFLPHLRTEQIPFPTHCIFWFLEYQMLDKAQKPSNSEDSTLCYTSYSQRQPTIKKARTDFFCDIFMWFTRKVQWLRYYACDTLRPGWQYALLWGLIASWEGHLGIATRLLTGQLRNWGSISGGDKQFFSSPEIPYRPWGPSKLLSTVF
jgi:hypothetical protein